MARDKTVSGQNLAHCRGLLSGRLRTEQCVATNRSSLTKCDRGAYV